MPRCNGILAEDLPYIDLWYLDNVLVHNAAGAEPEDESGGQLRFSAHGGVGAFDELTNLFET
jgi:hypothetical protein